MTAQPLHSLVGSPVDAPYVRSPTVADHRRARDAALRRAAEASTEMERYVALSQAVTAQTEMLFLLERENRG